MDQYSLHDEIGDGAFGVVFRGIRKTTGEEVAIKQMKQDFKSWNEITELREFQAIKALSHQSKYLVEIFDIIRESDAKLYFVCELMPDGTLHDFIRKTRRQQKQTSNNEIPPTGVEPALIRSVVWQVLQGLQHIHSKGYIHRDLKPENILLKGIKCKIADFSLARTAVATQNMTSYVATRWYRPPEIILCDPQYSKPVDIFSLGCVMAEMFQLSPLFPGTKEIDQLCRIFELLGPLEEHWPEGVQYFNKLGFQSKFPSSFVERGEDQGGQVDSPLNRLQNRITTADTVALRFLLTLLLLDPKQRPCARKALDHAYFGKVGRSPIPVVRENVTERLARPAFFLDSLPTSNTTTPAKGTIAGDSARNPSRAPFVSISPSMRNKMIPERNLESFEGSMPQFGDLVAHSPLDQSSFSRSIRTVGNCKGAGKIPSRRQNYKTRPLGARHRLLGTCRPCDAFLADF